MVKIRIKIHFPRRDPNQHQNLINSHSSHPSKNFIKIRQQLFELSCWQTVRQTDNGQYITSLVQVTKLQLTTFRSSHRDLGT